MRRGGRLRGGAAAFALLVIALPTAQARAQEEAEPAPLAVVGGQLHYHLPEAGNGGLIAARLAAPLAPLGVRHWLLEPSMGYGWYHGVDSLLHHVLLMEMQVQVQAGRDPVRPYVGVGGGLSALRIDSTTHLQLTFSASGGVRLRLLRDLGVAGEVRVRRHDLFGGWTRELTVGLFGLIR